MKDKRALSEVVATLIILVISVLLAGVVTYYAINVVSTRVQEESLTLDDAHIWLNPTATAGSATYSQASLKIINTGGRDVVIQKVEIRGQDAAWSSYTGTGSSATDSQFVVYSTTNEPIETDLYFQPSMIIPSSDPTASNAPTQTLSLLGSGTSDQFTFSYATTNLVLASGDTMILYIINPDSITINDIGLTVSITIYTAQAMYYEECNVQAYSALSAAV